ncbi:MAG TPA: hypothetical protein ENH14_03095 [candidate division WOR-3 bacterium]|uniref:RNA polymerase sigma-54 factor n=1 Tax=candidate division WOR-3 bacterium TaxID=2052148 RepID=A0A7V0LUV7_UNCW3|nr:hypothetical protein [candidate division WOR-3 bacterium]
MKQDFRLELKQTLKPLPLLIVEAKLLELPLLELQDKIREEALQNPFIEFQDESLMIQEIINLDQIIDRGDYSHPLVDEDEERDRIDERWVQKDSIWPRLEIQLEMEFPQKKLRLIAYSILNRLDEKGFLSCSVEEIAQEVNTSPEIVEKVREKIMRFDPLGVGALNVKEYTILQLHDRGFKNVKDPGVFIKEHPEVKKFLLPYPLYKYEDTKSPYVYPEVIIKIEGNELRVEVDENPILNFRVNKKYLELLQSPDLDKQTRKFLKEKYQKVLEFQRMLLKRRENIRKVAEFIAESQKDFLLGKNNFLVPITQKEAASQLNIPISTFNRIVKNKYADTPRGIFELRFFFKKAVGRFNSRVSEDELLLLIKEIVENENPQKPYSDEDIAIILKQKGINISRRSVRDKRAQLGIPPSSKRRRV